jgi:hypothetical protein
MTRRVTPSLGNERRKAEHTIKGLARSIFIKRDKRERELRVRNISSSLRLNSFAVFCLVLRKDLVGLTLCRAVWIGIAEQLLNAYIGPTGEKGGEKEKKREREGRPVRICLIVMAGLQS